MYVYETCKCLCYLRRKRYMKVFTNQSRARAWWNQRWSNKVEETPLASFNDISSQRKRGGERKIRTDHVIFSLTFFLCVRVWVFFFFFQVWQNFSINDGSKKTRLDYLVYVYLLVGHRGCHCGPCFRWVYLTVQSTYLYIFVFVCDCVYPLQIGRKLNFPPVIIEIDFPRGLFARC